MSTSAAKKGEKIVYLLGAGASINAVPILNNFHHDMMDKLNYIIKHKNSSSIIYENMPNVNLSKTQQVLEEIIQLCFTDREWFYNVFLHQETIDTLAKRLLLKNDKNIRRLKALMALYLVWIQKPDSIDLRYDTLLIKLFKNAENKIVFPHNVNFVSWNYDLQFELNLIKYLDKTKIDDIHCEYPIWPNCSDMQNLTSELPILTKLNGTAGLFYDNIKNKIFSISPNLDVDNDLDENKLHLLNSYRELINNDDKDNLIHFADEDHPIPNEALCYAEKIFSNATKLVIIGYSFHNFNFKKDNQLLTAFTLKKAPSKLKIYIQDPFAEKIKNTILKNFKNIDKYVNYNFGDGNMKIMLENDCNKFLAPIDLTD